MPNAGVYSIAYTMTTLSHTQKTKNQMRRIEFMEHKTQISCSIYFHSTRNLYYLNKQIRLNNNNNKTITATTITATATTTTTTTIII